MAELVALAASRYEHGSTVFVSNVTVSDKTLNYVVGFPYAIGKYMLYYNGENVARLSPFAKNVMFFSACIAVIFAFAYAVWLFRKLSTMIGSIRNIRAGSYTPMKETGVFGEIYASLNKLDMEIRRSEKIQRETDRTRKEMCIRDSSNAAQRQHPGLPLQIDRMTGFRVKDFCAAIRFREASPSRTPAKAFFPSLVVLSLPGSRVQSS